LRYFNQLYVLCEEFLVCLKKKKKKNIPLQDSISDVVTSRG